MLVTTLTKKMAEDLTAPPAGARVPGRYLHSGSTPWSGSRSSATCIPASTTSSSASTSCARLDLPEVSLVVITDADKEGFLRGETSLIR